MMTIADDDPPTERCFNKVAPTHDELFHTGVGDRPLRFRVLPTLVDLLGCPAVDGELT